MFRASLQKIFLRFGCWERLRLCLEVDRVDDCGRELGADLGVRQRRISGSGMDLGSLFSRSQVVEGDEQAGLA